MHRGYRWYTRAGRATICVVRRCNSMREHLTSLERIESLAAPDSSLRAATVMVLRLEPHDAVVHLNPPATFVDAGVTCTAQQNSIGQICPAGVPVPPANVMRVTPAWRCTTRGTSTIAFYQS